MVVERGTKATLLAHARAAARALANDISSPQARSEVCLNLLSDTGADPRQDAFQRALQALPADERHYWIGTLYTLLLPTKVRRTQATYFTPPTVAE